MPAVPLASYADALWACHEFLPHVSTVPRGYESCMACQHFILQNGGGLTKKPKSKENFNSMNLNP